MPPPPRPSSGYVENDSGPSSPVSAKPRSGSTTTTKPIVTPETSAPERVASRPAARPSASSSTTGGTSKEKEPAMKTNADKSQPAKAKPTPKSSGSATTSSATTSGTAAKKDPSQPATAGGPASASTTPTTMTPKHHRGSSVQSLQSSHSRRPSESNAAPASASAVGLGGALIAPASAVNTAMRSKAGPADGTGGGKGGRAARSSSTLQFEENDGRTASVSSVGSAACSAVVAGAVDADRTGQKKSSPPRSAKATTQRSLNKASSAALAAATTSVGRDTDSDAELLADLRRGHSPYGSTFDDDVVSTQRVSVAVRIRPTLAVGVNAIEKMQPQAIFRDNETATADLGEEKDVAGKAGRDASPSSSSKQTGVQKGRGKGASPPPSKSSSVAAADAAGSSLKVSTPTVSVVIPPPPMPQYGGRPFDVFSPMAPSTGPGQPVPGVPVTPVSKEGVHRYAFDHVFDETDGQAQVYESCIHGPLHVALAQGTDLTVLAYGQTGSGKTHTMLGPATSNATTTTSMDVQKTKNGGAGSGRSRSPLSALPADRSTLKESPSSSSVAVKQSSSALGGATPSKDRTSGSAFSRTHTSPVSAHHATVGIPVPSSDPALSPHSLRSNQIVDGATPPRSQSSRQQNTRGPNPKGDDNGAGDRDEFTLGMSPTRAERERSSVESGLTSASGVFPRVIHDVLEFRRQRAPAGVHVTASLQAVEVYNDMLLDLLDTKRPSIAFREAGDEIHLASTSTVDVRDPQCAKRAFALAAQNRTVASTTMNDTSSRSHAVFLIDIHQRLDPSSANTSAAINAVPSTYLNEPTTFDRHDSLDRGSMSTAFTRSNTAVVSADRDVSLSGVTSRSGVSSGVGGGGSRVCRTRIMLVDLAGSERIKQSGVKGTQLSEAVHVNKSLSALGSVVLHLCRGSKHIPYRTSTLTRLLRPTLQSGKSRTLFICNVAPTTATAQESLAALNFAHRLKELALPTTTMDADSTPAAMALRSDEERALCERRFELSMLAAELRLATVDTAPKQTSLVDHFHQQQQQSTNATAGEATGDPQTSAKSSPQERLTVAQLRQKFESGTTEPVSRSLFDDSGAVQAGGAVSTPTAVSPYAGLVGDDEAIAGAIAVTSAVQRLYTDEAKAADVAGSNNVSASASVSVSALSTPMSAALKTPTTPSRTPVMTPGRVAQKQAQAAAETALRESNVTVEERRALRLPLPRGAVSKIVKRGGASATASRASESSLRSSAVSELADELVQEWTRQATESATVSSLHGHQTPTPIRKDSEESSAPGEGAASSRSTSVGKGATRRPQTVSTPKSLAAATAVASYKRHLRLVISKTAELEQARAKHTKEVGELEAAEVALREAKANAKTAAGRWDRLLEHRQQQKEAAASLSSPKPQKAKPNGKDGDDDFTPEEVTLAELHELQVELRLRRITLTKERSALDAVGKVIHSDLQNSEAAAKRRLKIEEERATRARVAVQHLQRQNGKDREVTAAASGSVGAVAASIRAWQRKVDTWVLSSLLDAALVRSEAKASKSKSPDKKPSKMKSEELTKEGEAEQADDEKAVDPMDVEASLKKGTDAISHVLATFTHQDKALLPHAHHRGPASASSSAPSASARKTSTDQNNANVGLKPRGPDVEAEAVLMQRPLELPFTVFTHGGSVGGAEKSSSAAAEPESLEGRVRFCLPPRPSLVRQKSAQLDKTRPRPAPVVPTNRRSRKSPKPQTPGAAKEPMVLPRSAAVPVNDAAARAIDALKQRPFSTQAVGASVTEKSGDISRNVGGGDVLSDTSGTEYSIDEDGTCRRSKERNARPRQAQRRLRRSIIADRSDRSSSVQRRLRQMSRDSIRRSREVREAERVNERERAREIAAQEEADRKEAERRRQEEAAAQARAQQEGTAQPGAGGEPAAEGDKSPREEENTNKPTAEGAAPAAKETTTEPDEAREKENKKKSKSRSSTSSSSPRRRKPLCLLDGQKTRSVMEPPTPEMTAMVARDLTEKQQQLHRESTVKVLQTISRVALKKTLTGQLIQQFSSALDLVMMPCELAPAALAETPARIAPDFSADDLRAIADIALGSHPGFLALPSSKSTRDAELASSKSPDGDSQGPKGLTGRSVPQGEPGKGELCREDPRVLELQRRCGVILRHCQATSVTASLLTLPTGAGDADGPAPEAAFLAKVASKMSQTNAPHEEPSAQKTSNTGKKDAKKKASEVSKETNEEETEASMMAAVAMFRLDMISSDLLKALDGDHVSDVVVSPATATTRRLDFENSSSGGTGAAGSAGSPAKSGTLKKGMPMKKAAHLRAQAVAAHHGVLRLLAIHLRSLRRFLRDDSNAALIDAFPAVSTLCPAPPSPIKIPSPIRGVLGKAPATPSGPPVSAEVERALGHPAPSAAAAGSVAVAQEDALATGRMAVPHLINALLCLAK